jgi:hypothetical protein
MESSSSGLQNPESEMQTLPKAASLTEKSGTNLSSSSEDSIATVHTNGNEVINICQESSPVKSSQNLNSPLVHKGDNQRELSSEDEERFVPLFSVRLAAFGKVCISDSGFCIWRF